MSQITPEFMDLIHRFRRNPPVIVAGMFPQRIEMLIRHLLLLPLGPEDEDEEIPMPLADWIRRITLSPSKMILRPSTQENLLREYARYAALATEKPLMNGPPVAVIQPTAVGTPQCRGKQECKVNPMFEQESQIHADGDRVNSVPPPPVPNPPTPANLSVSGMCHLEPDVRPRLRSIVTTAYLSKNIDLKALARKINKNGYIPVGVRPMKMQIDDCYVWANIYPNGIMMCEGATHERHAYFAAKLYAVIISRLGFGTSFSGFKIQNIVAVSTLNFKIRVQEMHQAYSSYTKYFEVPARMLVFNIFNSEVDIKIYASGNIVFSGAKTRDEIITAFTYIYPIVKLYEGTNE